MATQGTVSPKRYGKSGERRRPMLYPTTSTLWPSEIEEYNSLCPLEPITQETKMQVSTFNAIHKTYGNKVCLRRLPGKNLKISKYLPIIDTWLSFRHANVVHLRAVQQTKAFGDTSTVFAYEYHPDSQTLSNIYLNPPLYPNGGSDPFRNEPCPMHMQCTKNGPLLPEPTIWAIVTQIVAGLHGIHQAGLSCRDLSSKKIILTGKRVRISFAGLEDILLFNPNSYYSQESVKLHQQDDLTALGSVVLTLACRYSQAVISQNIILGIEKAAQFYSKELVDLCRYLLTVELERSSTDVMSMIFPRIYMQFCSLERQCDKQEDQLSEAAEKERFFRLMSKLNYVTKKLEDRNDNAISESGHLYMLKLFHEFVFQPADFDNIHIIMCLSKLDAGAAERIKLKSHNEETVIIVSYGELKICLEETFNKILASIQDTKPNEETGDQEYGFLATPRTKSSKKSEPTEVGDGLLTKTLYQTPWRRGQAKTTKAATLPAVDTGVRLYRFNEQATQKEATRLEPQRRPPMSRRSTSARRIRKA